MKWYQKWKERRRIRRRREGWDFAAGMLLENAPNSIELLELHIEDAHAFGTWDVFDDGIVAALEKHERSSK